MARINRGRTSSVGKALKGATSRVAHARILMIISDHLENVGPNFSSNNNNNNNNNNHNHNNNNNNNRGLLAFHVENGSSMLS